MTPKPSGRIFIAFSEHDGAAVAAIAAQLRPLAEVILIRKTDEARQHDPEEQDCLVLVWSESSATSPDVYEIARVIELWRRTHIYLGTVAEGLVPTTVLGRLPRDLIAASDVPMLIRAIRLSLRPDYDPDPQPLFAIGGFDEELHNLLKAKRAKEKRDHEDIVAVEAGRLVHQIPEQMWVGRPEVVEVRLGNQSERQLMVGLLGSGEQFTEDLKIVETMTVELSSAEPGAFEIVGQSRPTQLVRSDTLKGVILDTQNFGRWIWHVTPLQTGRHELLLRVSGELIDSSGIQGSAVLPDRLFRVTIKVDFVRAASKALGHYAWYGLGIVVTGIISAATREIWWPYVKPWLEELLGSVLT